MGFYSELDMEINDMISQGATRDEVLVKYPFLSERELLSIRFVASLGKGGDGA